MTDHQSNIEALLFIISVELFFIAWILIGMFFGIGKSAR